MNVLRTDLIKSLILNKNKPIVPESVCKAIGDSVTSESDEIASSLDYIRTTFDYYRNRVEPLILDYSGKATIDAYALYFMPRNVIIPSIALLLCSYHPKFQTIPKKIKVLDIGSGAGAITLGLLDFFSKPAFSGTKLEITAVDSSGDALLKQNDLIKRLGRNRQSVKLRSLDLSNSEALKRELQVNGPYDIVFASNVLTELHPAAIDELMEEIAGCLTDAGIFVSVEAHRSYVMEQRCRVSSILGKFRLNTVYPCPPGSICSNKQCRKWREDELDCPNIHYSSGVIEPKKIKRVNWFIFSKNGCSIYDILVSKYPNLVWGVSAYGRISGDEKAIYDYEFCTQRGTIKKKIEWKIDQEPVKSGMFVGFSQDLSRIEVVWDILSGFRSSK